MEKLKAIWSDRKTRGIIFLILYFILFSYIFIVYGNKTEKIILPENKPEKQEEKAFDNYKYNYVTDENRIEITKYNEIVNFKLNDIDYYYLDGKCYKLEGEKLYEVENPLKYNFDYLNKIKEIKDLSTRIKTSKYEDGKEEENYNVNLAQLLELFGITEEVDAKEMTNYSIFFKDKNISEIVFNDLNFKIEYLSIGDIEKIDANYEIATSEE